MTGSAILAQAAAEGDTSSAAIVAFGLFVLVAVLATAGLAWPAGRRYLLPAAALLLGVSIVATSVLEAFSNGLSPITFIGVFIGGLVAVGGAGAFREGTVVPEVEGVEPPVETGVRPPAEREPGADEMG